MNLAETLFSLLNSLALVGWVLLLFAPRWRWTSRLVLSGAIPLLLSIAYLALIVTKFGQAEGGFDSLAGVMQLFRDQWAVLTGWTHYLAFDLFIGAWEVKDAQERSISHWLVFPCLAFTFLLGPIGLLGYFAIRFFKERRSLWSSMKGDVKRKNSS